MCQTPLFAFFFTLLLEMWHIINFYSVKLNETLKSVLRTLHPFTVFLKNSIFVQATFPYIFGCTACNRVLSGMVGIKFIYYYMGPMQVNNPKLFFFFLFNLKYIIQHCHKLRMVLALDILSNLIYYIYWNIR